MNMDVSFAPRFSKVFKFYNTIILLRLLIIMFSTLDLVAGKIIQHQSLCFPTVN